MPLDIHDNGVFMHVGLVLPSFDLATSISGAIKLKRGFLPPLGIGYIASSLKAHGHEISFVDACALGLDTMGTVSAVLAEKPDLVGISCLTRLSDAAYSLAREIKVCEPEMPIVLGGAHATSFYDEILDVCPHVDVVVPGEGERVFVELVNRIEQGKPIDDIEGILYRDADGNSVATPNAEHVKNLDSLPHPDRSIYKNELYVPLPSQNRRMPATTMITGRGCPYGKCRFCYQGGRYAHHYRRRSPEHVVDEIRHLVRDMGVREIVFQDDSFCLGGKWIRTFCDLLDRDKIDLTWAAQCRVDQVDPELLKRMAASGCYNVYYGFESGNERMLDLIDKGITLEQSRLAVKWAKDAGLEIRGSFIIGFPTETPEISAETIRFACELNVDYMIFYPYRVQHGTRLEEFALSEGRLLNKELVVHVPSYLPNTYSSADQLARTIKRAYLKYYLRPRYIGRALWRTRKPVVIKNHFDSFLFWLGMVLPKRKSAPPLQPHANVD